MEMFYKAVINIKPVIMPMMHVHLVCFFLCTVLANKLPWPPEWSVLICLIKLFWKRFITHYKRCASLKWGHSDCFSKIEFNQICQSKIDEPILKISVILRQFWKTQQAGVSEPLITTALLFICSLINYAIQNISHPTDFMVGLHFFALLLSLRNHLCMLGCKKRGLMAQWDHFLVTKHQPHFVSPNFFPP